MAPVVTLVLWRLSLGQIDLAAMQDTGLVSVLPPAYVGALAVLFVGFVLELRRPHPRRVVILSSLAALVVVLYATVPVLYTEPRYAYVYKHIAVTRYVGAHGGVSRPIEIYQNWSGFPGLWAQISAITGVDAMAYANWAQLLFASANVLAVRYAIRAFTDDGRVIAVALWLYVVGDWVGQNYFAPQALGLVLTLVLIGVVVRHFPPVPWVGPYLRAHRPRRPRPRTSTSDADAAAATAAASAVELAEAPRQGTRLGERGAALVAVALVIAIVGTHPLTSFVLVACLSALVLGGRARLWWLPLLAGLLAVVWTAAAVEWLTTHVNLFADVGSAVTNAKGTGGAGTPSVGQSFVVRAARLLSLGLWGGAVLGYWRRRRAGPRDATVELLALAPFALLFAQSYGGEAIYRVFLFSVPWCTFLVAWLLVGPGRRRVERPAEGPVEGLGRARLTATAGVLALATVLFLFAFFGLERINHVSPEEVAASEWFEQHAAPNSVLASVVSSFPTEVTADYDQYRTPWGTWGASVVNPSSGFGGRDLGAADVPAAITYLQGFSEADVYVAVSPGQEAYASAMGDAPPGAVTRFGEALRRYPGVEVAWSSGDVALLRLPRPAPGR